MKSCVRVLLSFAFIVAFSAAAQAGGHGHWRGHGGGGHWGGHHHRYNDHIRINLGVPYVGGAYCQEPAYYPAPVYYAPPPRPVYYVQPQPVYYYPAPSGVSFTWYSR